MELTYAEKLKHPLWQKKRLVILKRDKFKCKLCGDTETTLHVHHTKYSGNPWEVEDRYLKTLCEPCHSFVEWCNQEEIDIVAVWKTASMSNKNSYIFGITPDNHLLATGYNPDTKTTRQLILMNEVCFTGVSKFYKTKKIKY